MDQERDETYGKRLSDIITEALKVINSMNENGEIITLEEISDVVKLADRKCSMNNKAEEYFPVILENEIRDYIQRKCINGTTINRMYKAGIKDE